MLPIFSRFDPTKLNLWQPHDYSYRNHIKTGKTNRIIKVRTPHTILPKDWDFSKQGMKDRLAGSMEFNQKLQNLRKLLLDMYDKAIEETIIHRKMNEWTFRGC